MAPHFAVALLALATVPLGSLVSAEAQLVALAAIVLGCIPSTGMGRRLRAWYRAARYARQSADERREARASQEDRAKPARLRV